MGAFRKISPDAFFEAGIQEHHAAAMAWWYERDRHGPFLLHLWGLCRV